MNELFTPIHNEVLEALAKINLSPYEVRVLFAIWRKTYGFIDKKTNKRKKNDRISGSQIAFLTNLDRRHISRALKGLESKSVISRDDNSIGFSKNFIKSLSSAEMTPVISRDDSLSSVVAHTKEKKETLKKPTNVGRTDGHAPSPPEEGTLFARDTNFFLGLFKEINPGYTVFFRNKTEREAIENLRRQVGDERLEELILGLKQVIYRPYAPRITSPYKLLCKYGDLIAFVAQNHAGESFKYSTTQV